MKVNALAFNAPTATTGDKNQIINQEEELLFNNVDKNENNKENLIETQEKTSNDKVSFKEGLSLFAKGFVNKIKSMGKAIVEHPLRTVATIGVTVGAISALPLVGISSAVGASVLAIGFGVYAAGKTTIDIAETIKDNKEGRYDEVREDLQVLGGDGVDLALTLPFMPKAIKTIQRNIKYAPSIGLNTELISNLKTSTSLSDVQMNFAKANTAINYETIANEMGLAVKPELVYRNLPYDKGGFYEPAEGKMYFNENKLQPKTVQVYKQISQQLKNSNGIDPLNITESISPEEILRHELQHYKQFCDIANASGVDNLKTTVSDYYSSCAKAYGAKTTTPDADLEAIKRPKMTESDIVRPNYKTDNAIDAPNELKKFYETLDDFNKDLNDFYEKYNPPTEEFQAKLDNYYNSKEIAYVNKQDYLNAIEKLEKTNNIPKNVVDNMTNGDKSVFNSELYQKMVDSNSTVCDIQKVNSYIDGLEYKTTGMPKEVVDQVLKKYQVTNTDALFKTTNYRKAQLELYKINPLEKEAYAAQEQFVLDVLKNTPTVLNNAISELAITENEINSHTEDNSIMDNLEELYKWEKPQVKNIFQK